MFEIKYSENAVKQLKSISASNAKNAERMSIMIKTQFIRQSKKPIAVILDYEEYKRLKEIEQDKEDYFDALKIKMNNKKWISHSELKKELGI